MSVSTYKEEEGCYVYLPIAPAQAVAEGALERVVKTFFGGSIERTVATLLHAVAKESEKAL